MKKIILALLFGLTLSLTTQAQATLQFTTDTVWVNDPVSVNDIYRLSYLKSTDADTLIVVWERTEKELPAGWATAICDKNICWPETVDTKEFEIIPDEEADLYGHFYTDGNPGTGVLMIVAYEKENNSNGDTLIVMGRNYAVGVNKVVKQEITVYPNPARTSITIKLPETANGGIVEVYDILGNKVINKEVGAGEVEVDVASLPVGKYVVRFIDQDGTAYTKRFQKVN